MSIDQEKDKFEKDHPHPDSVGITSLFKFYKFDENHIDYLKNLFIEKKLYHSLPEKFNDPFECKPHYNFPKNSSKIKDIRKHLIKAAMERGHTKKSAQSLVLQRKKDFLQESIYNSIKNTFSTARIASFTTKKENLLFWSHYADSHKGFCVEYDSTVLPISYAYKVKYDDKYPEAVYPPLHNAVAFRPALVKSKAWKYEEEYRIIFVPYAAQQPDNDGTSLILKGTEMKNVYLGANMSEDNKKSLIEMIEDGAFNPGIWIVSLSKSSFKLEFNEYKNP